MDFGDLRDMANKHLLIASVAASAMLLTAATAQDEPGAAAAAALDDLLAEDGDDVSDGAAADDGASVFDDPAFASDSAETDEGAEAGPSELDALSRAADDQFPDLEARVDREPVSVTVRALNKVTAKYTDLTVAMNTLVAFGPLDIGAFHCDKRPPEDFPEVSAFLQVFDRSSAVRPEEETVEEAEEDAAPSEGADYSVERTGEARNAFEEAAAERAAAEAFADAGLSADGVAPEPEYTLEEPAIYDREPDGRKVFSGWMFASSPALNPLEHPVYDVWVIDCETRAATVSAETPENASSAP